MKLITRIQVEQADHTQVIDTAATNVGRAANKAFLFVIHKEIQGWHNFTALCSWALSKVGQKHGPIFEEVKGSAVAVFRKGCSQETAFIQGLIQTQLTDRIDAHWKQHDKAFDWFKAQTQAFLADNPVEDSSEGKSEERSPDITEELTIPVAQIEEPVSEAEESVVVVLDPPVDPDPLDDEMMIPEDPTPVQASAGGKRRTTRKKVESSLSGLLRQEDAKYSA